jgi:hypothetical protein
MAIHSSFTRVGWMVAVAVALGACSSGGSGSTGSSTGHAGTTGAAGTTSDTAGSTGNGGSSSTGNAGTMATGGSVGTTGNGGASAAGTTGTGGAIAGTTGSGGATAGTSGSAGTGGVTGSGGATGAGGLANAVASDGCGKDAGQMLAMYVKYSIMVSGVSTAAAPRDYYVWLPSNYDNHHAYPTVFVGPGCGSNGTQGIQIQTASGNDAIVIGLDASTHVDPEGRECFDSQTYPNNPEIPYVEQTVAAVEAAFCIDKSHLFIEGFSSGSWLSYLMGCVDGGPGGLFKAQGNASGEDQGWTGKMDSFKCKGPTPWMAGHNNPDPNNAYPGGRDHEILMNGCTMPPVTTPFDPGPMVKPPATPAGVMINCVQYMGCQVPTIFCTTTNLGHNDQQMTGLSTYGFWNFWMSLH